MPARRCNRCERSLAAMPLYRRRGETFRPGSIMPTVKRYQRGRPALCDECWRMLPPAQKREYAVEDSQERLGWG